MELINLLDQYARTEDGLRRRTTELRAEMKRTPYPERDVMRKRLAVLQEELYDVELIRMEISRRKGEFLC